MDTFAIKDLTFSYPEGQRTILNNLSFTIKQGQFVTLCGPSGCGKTTLLRHLKPTLTPHGRKSGTVLFENTDLNYIDMHTQSCKIGFVMQSPDNQIVTDKVWHELAFGLESLGMDTPQIRRRVAEMASFFGIQTWFHKKVSELSGGQKQLLNLASIMAMQPSVLILDEPTSQLDPIAAAEFLDIVGKINRELGITIILTEHRLEEVFPHTHRVLVMDKGQIICDSDTRTVGAELQKLRHNMSLAMPVPMRVYAATDSNLTCPVTVSEGREWLSQMPIKRYGFTAEQSSHNEPSIELSNVWFKYEKDLPDVVKDLSFSAYSGEICAILGGNGTGKTTTLSIISGINKPYWGKVKIYCENVNNISGEHLFDELLGVLPQNPQSLFVKKKVYDDLLEMLSGKKLSKQEKQERISAVTALCRLETLLKSHPYDLSGGEQQRAALAKVLLLRPKILLLDEPTKGLDAEFKIEFADILRSLCCEGATVLMVSHDIEFCAEHADRCAMFFDGGIVSEGEPRAFFSGNSFYTTAANRMARHILPGAITAGDIIEAIGGISSNAVGQGRSDSRNHTAEKKERLSFRLCLIAQTPKKLPTWRKITAGISGAILLALLIFAGINSENILSFISGGDMAINISKTQSTWEYITIIFSIMLCAGAAVWALNPSVPHEAVQTPKEKRKLSKRTILAAAMILLAIPLTIYIGIYYLGDRKYYFISMLVLFETMLPFTLVFESRKPQARELIIISVLCAIAVAGRAAFFMLPQFKPVVAIVIIAGVAFGGESGFLVGAMTGFLSNMFFGQGPWTPWQMFAFGIIGFLAGVCFKKGILRRNTISLCLFGGFATFLIYGGIMNPAAVLMFQAKPTKEMLYLAYLQGIPFDLVHAAATVTFLILTAQSMLEKLDRIKIKYGLVE